VSRAVTGDLTSDISDGPRAEQDGVAVFGGFEGASLEGVRAAGTGLFEADCLEEPGVPELAFNRVFYDYSFACGIHNASSHRRQTVLRLRLCARSARRNMGFMCGPYWIRRGGWWHHLTEAAHSTGDDWVETRLDLEPGERLVLASKPFWTAAETQQVLAEYEQRLPFTRVRSIGQTAEARDILAIETEPREQAIVVSSSLQSAEFAGDVCLHLLDWLGTETLPIQQWLRQYQFCLVPETMPDSVAAGLSIMNTQGRCPMFDSGAAFAGEQPCAEEATALTGLLQDKRPALWIDLHVHPGRYNSPKLNPVKAEMYPTSESADRAGRVEAALAQLFPGERNIAVPVDDAEFSMRDSSLVLAVERLGTAAFCFQDYARTEEGKKAMMVVFMEAVLRAMHGESQTPRDRGR